MDNTVADDNTINRGNFLSQAESNRFDRWVEFGGALVMSIATVAIAWCAYQATLWGGDESRLYFESSTAQITAGQIDNQAQLRSSIHVGLFSQYVNALGEGDEVLGDFYYQRFPEELKTATDAWLLTDPLNDPHAPGSPFEMDAYRLAEQDAAVLAQQQSEELFEMALAADENADNYVLLTVVFATVLFFSGIAGKFQWQTLDAVVLVVGTVALLVGFVLLLQIPIQ